MRKKLVIIIGFGGHTKVLLDILKKNLFKIIGFVEKKNIKSFYLNSHNIKTPNGKDYTRHLIGMFFYKYRKMNNRLKHSELKITNIRFWIRN